MNPPLTLFHYWRSSASWRVRWAFSLKKIPCQWHAVSLLNGESESTEHRARNPLGYVPVLAMNRGYICESLAIIEWAEESYPTPALLPGDAWNRAQIRSLSEMINADTHPLQNLNVQAHHSEDPDERKRWAQHWIRNGLEAFEKQIALTAGLYSVGDQVTLADLCLIPQVYNARRFEVDLSPMPLITAIFERAMKTEACIASAPERFEPIA